MIAFLVPFTIAMSGPILNASHSDAEERMQSLPGFTMQDLATNTFWHYGGVAAGVNITAEEMGTFWYPDDRVNLFWWQLISARLYHSDAPGYLFEKPPGEDHDVLVFFVQNSGDPGAQDDYARYSYFMVVAQQWGMINFQYKVFDLSTAEYDNDQHGMVFHAQLEQTVTIWLKAGSVSEINDGTFTVFLGQSLVDQAQGSNDMFSMLASAISMSWTTGNVMLDWFIKLPLIFAYCYVAFILITRLIPFT